MNQILFGRETSGILFHLSEQKYGPHTEGGYVVSPAHHVLHNCLDDIILVKLRRKHYEHALPEAVKEFPTRNNMACLLAAVNLSQVMNGQRFRNGKGSSVVPALPSALSGKKTKHFHRHVYTGLTCASLVSTEED